MNEDGEKDRAAWPVRILTLFPEMIRQAAAHSIIGRASESGLLDVRAIDIRDFTFDKHKTADDVPFGGGPGMVMKPEPLAGAIRAAKAELPGAPVVLMSASGRLFNQATARRYAFNPAGLIIVCGHYEGVDERIAVHFCDEEICVGDYVLSGGELPALTVMDAAARLIPGVLGNAGSLDQESHDDLTLEYPQYTRPRDFEGYAVPEVLFSGNHAAIAKFRREQALVKTARNRPDYAGERVGPLTAGGSEESGAVPVEAGNRTTGVPAGWGRPDDK